MTSNGARFAAMAHSEIAKQFAQRFDWRMGYADAAPEVSSFMSANMNRRMDGRADAPVGTIPIPRSISNEMLLDRASLSFVSNGQAPASTPSPRRLAHALLEGAIERCLGVVANLGGYLRDADTLALEQARCQLHAPACQIVHW